MSEREVQCEEPPLDHQEYASAKSAPDYNKPTIPSGQALDGRSTEVAGPQQRRATNEAAGPDPAIAVAKSANHGPAVAAETKRVPWAQQELKPARLVGWLCLQSLQVAILDAVTFGAYGVFSTAQTGNTIILAQAAVGGVSNSPLPVGVSLAAFLVSAFITGQFLTRAGARKRWVILALAGWQILPILIVTILVSPAGLSSFRSRSSLDWVIFLLLAIQGGPQVVSAQSAGVPEIPVVVMTNAYTAFVSQPGLFMWPGEVRDRRLWYILSFWAGAFIGAAMWKWSQVWAALLLVLLIKMVAFAWILLLPLG